MTKTECQKVLFYSDKTNQDSSYIDDTMAHHQLEQVFSRYVRLTGKLASSVYQLAK